MKVAKHNIILIRKLNVIFYLLIFTSNISNAQLLTPVSRELNLLVEKYLLDKGEYPFTVSKPFYDSQLSGKARQDSLDLLTPVYQGNNTYLVRKIFRESLLLSDSLKYFLFADPLFNFGLGKEKSGPVTWINTRGFRAGGRIGELFAFETEFYENQAVFNSAIENHIRNSHIIPGQGLAKPYGTKGWDYSSSSGYISFSPVMVLNVQAGYGKQFIGDGYRSLILSDASFYYPYAKITLSFKNFMYSWMLSLLQEYDTSKVEMNDLFFRKTFSTHLISVNLFRKLQISLIESEMHNNPDTFGIFRSDWKLFNPVMMLYSPDNKIHTLWGTNVKFNLTNKLLIYNQWAFDNLASGEPVYSSVQAGFKYFDVLGVKGLFAQAEFNQVQPNTYKSSNQLLNWNHYGESLAHPYGDNFKEEVVFLTYSWHRWKLSSQTNLVKQLSNNAEDKYPTTTGKIPGIPYYSGGQKLYWENIQLNLYLNPKTLMNFSLGYTFRKEDLPGSFTTMNYLYFAFSTSLVNLYNDF